MIPADNHVHSAYSSDSNTPVRDQIGAALAKGMRYFYLTDHHDIDFPAEEAGGLDFQLDTPAYLAEMRSLREEYKDRIEIRIGVELGLMESVYEKANAYTDTYDFDFIIGSSHLVRGKDPYYPSFYEGRDQKEAYREYFEAEAVCAKTFDNFDIYGHVDYVMRYGPDRSVAFKYADYGDILDELLKTLIQKGKGIEINTAGLFKGLGYAHPHSEILTRYKELGGEIITVGSDAHATEHYAYGFDVAEELLKAHGFKYIALYKNRKPEMVSL